MTNIKNALTQDTFSNYTTHTNIGFMRRLRLTSNYTWEYFFIDTDQQLPIAVPVLVYDII